MILPVLYSFRRCPYAMRARMALLIARQPVRLREVALGNKPDALRAASPKATVPVLVLEDGRAIDESLAIMQWALGRNDPEAWLAEPGQQDELAALIAANDGPFKHHLDRYKYASRYEGADPQLHYAAALKCLEDLNARLEPAGQLLGPRRTLADIALFPFVRQFRIADPDAFDALPLTALKRWLAGHMASALFTSVMAKYPPWQEGQTEPVLGSV